MTASQKAGVRGAKAMQKAGKKAAPVATKDGASTAVVKHDPRMYVSEVRTAEQRVDLIRKSLDQMENVQLTMASGAVMIGLELLALKSDLGYGEFGRVFAERIERPRFSSRTAHVYMQAADKVRVNLLRAGAEGIAEVFDVAPSAMSMANRNKLVSAVGSLLSGKTLSNLLLDLDSKPKMLPTGRTPATGAAAEMEAHVALWSDLTKRLANEGVARKSWKFLEPDKITALRKLLTTVLNELPSPNQI
jgi:hypothetical protein